MKASRWDLGCWLWLAALTAHTAHAQQSAEIVFKVVAVTDDQREAPLENVFVFVPPKLSHSQPLRDWLTANAQPKEATVHSLSVRDDVLHPKALIAYVGDSLPQLVDGRFGLQYLFMNNPPYCSLEPNLKLEASEPMIVKVSVVGMDKIQNANLLVADHTLNRLTDDRGKAVFSQVPSNMAIPFQIRVDGQDGKGKHEYSSDTLTFAKYGKFTVDTTKSEQEHVIRVKKL